MTQVSGFILSSEFEVSETFTEISELSSSGFNVLLQAKRNGQWWILKSLKPDVCHDSTFLQLQQKEYDILARLDHPGIVKVEGLEEVEGYGRCIVMEWIDGVTLELLLLLYFLFGFCLQFLWQLDMMLTQNQSLQLLHLVLFPPFFWLFFLFLLY